MRKRKKRFVEKGRKKNQKLGVYIIAVIMLSSALYFGLRRYEPVENVVQKPPIEQYNVVRVGNKTVLLQINDSINELIAIPRQRVVINWETIGSIVNGSIEGVDSIICEASDSYVLFKFHFYGDIENVTPNVRSFLDAERGEYELYRAYIGTVGSDSVYIVGRLDTDIGGYIRAILFQKVSENQVLGLIAFEQKKVTVGPFVNATVVGTERLVVEGSASVSVDVESIKNVLDIEDLSYDDPTILTANISNDILEKIKNLTEVRVENETMVLNYSKEVIEILDENAVTYSIKEGFITFTLDEETDTSSVNSILIDNGVKDIRIRKPGYVSIPQDILIDNKLIFIENNENFSAVLQPNNSIKDNVTIRLGVLQIGERVIPWSAEVV